MKLLLLSNSTNPNEPYLSWPLDYIERMMDGCKNAVFVPYAAVGFSYDEYESRVNESLAQRGLNVTSIHRSNNLIQTLDDADAILVGGGNTFHLLHELQRLNLVEKIKSRELMLLKLQPGRIQISPGNVEALKPCDSFSINVLMVTS